MVTWDRLQIPISKVELVNVTLFMMGRVLFYFSIFISSRCYIIEICTGLWAQILIQVEPELEEPQLYGDINLLFSLDKRPLIPNNCMPNIYYCLSTVSWKGHLGFHKGVVKSTFPFSIYQQPCNSGGLKYGQSACYSTSLGCPCSFYCTHMVPPPPFQTVQGLLTHQACTGT